MLINGVIGVIELNLKAMYRVVTLCCLMVISSHSYAALIFQLDNAVIPEINLLGLDPTGVHLYFEPDKLDIGDSYDLLIDAMSGGSELASALNVNFNLSELTAYFNDSGEGASFYGVAQRPDDQIDMPELTSLLLLLLALGFIWSSVIVNTYHNA